MVILGDKVQHTLSTEGENVVVKVRTDSPLPFSGRQAILADRFPSQINTKAEFYLTVDRDVFEKLKKAEVPSVFLPESLIHIESGDIIRLSRGDNHLRVLVKKKLEVSVIRLEDDTEETV